MTLVCPDCQVCYAVKRNGVPVELMARSGGYQIWHGDLLECPGCHARVVGNFPNKPLADSKNPADVDLVASLRCHQDYQQAWSSPKEKAAHA